MPSNIEQNVMRRVHTIHALRPVVSPGAFSILVALLALWGIGSQVWVARVFENAPTDITLVPQFFVSAFTHTEFIVQVLSVLVLVSVIYLARETAKLLTRTLSLATT